MVKRLNVYIDPADPMAAIRLYHALRFEKSVNLIPPSGVGPDTGALYDFLCEHAVDALFAPAGAGDLVRYMDGRAYSPVIFQPSGDAPTAVGQFSPGDAAGQNASSFLVDCYTDRAGQLRYHFVQEAVAAGGGLRRVVLATGAHSGLEAMADALNKQYRPQGGWCFCALREPGGRLRLLSLNMSGLDAASLSRLRGANFPALMLFEAMGHDIGFLLQHDMPCAAHIDDHGIQASATPEFERVFFDLDDTLIIHGQVNADAVAFLMRCKAQQKPITLITRHYREPGITLAELGIEPDLFDRVTWITDGSSKAAHIPANIPAIFIDDAYKERRDVAAGSSCRVFAPDALPALAGGIMQEMAPR